MQKYGIVLALVAALVAAVATSAAAVKPQTINLLEVSTSFVGTGGLDESFSSPPKVGQGFVIGSDFYKWKGTKRGAHYGTLEVVCTFTKVGEKPGQESDFCSGAALLPGGQIALAGVIKQSKGFDVPIVGGTGVYAGARGYVRVKEISDTNSADTFVITG